MNMFQKAPSPSGPKPNENPCQEPKKKRKPKQYTHHHTQQGESNRKATACRRTPAPPSLRRAHLASRISIPSAAAHHISWCRPPSPATPPTSSTRTTAHAEMAAPALRSAAARARAAALSGGRWLGTSSAAETERERGREKEEEEERAGWELSAAREYYDYRKSIYGDVTHRALLVDAVGTLVVPAQPTAQVSEICRCLPLQVRFFVFSRLAASVSDSYLRV
jgi:hypothetical protein